MAAPRSRRTKAIVLDRTKLSEQDLILTLLAETGEQLRVVAKGARRPGGRLAARVELFCETDFLVARGRGALGVVSEAAVADAHAGLRGDLARVSAASAVAEVARLTCYEDAPDALLEPLCARAISACEQAPDQERLDLVVAAYALKVLAHAGWRPQLDACVACGEADVAYLSPSAGGAVCASCVRDVPDAAEASVGSLAWLSYLMGATFDEIVAVAVDADTAAWLAGVAHQWAATHLDARLRAFEFHLAL